MSNEESGYNPYCPICSGCGEEGCCSPLVCKQSPNGHYCQSYLNDLKFGYMMYEAICELNLISTDEETQKKFDEIWNKNYDIIYKNE